jgi:hypothetical protein
MKQEGGCPGAGIKAFEMDPAHTQSYMPVGSRGRRARTPQAVILIKNVMLPRRLAWKLLGVYSLYSRL